MADLELFCDTAVRDYTMQSHMCCGGLLECKEVSLWSLCGIAIISAVLKVRGQPILDVISQMALPTDHL